MRGTGVGGVGVDFTRRTWGEAPGDMNGAKGVPGKAKGAAAVPGWPMTDPGKAPNAIALAAARP